MKLTVFVAVSSLLSISAAAYAMAPQTASVEHPEAAEILAAALDYGEGWYEGDAERMKRALHPELAKRVVVTDANGHSRLGQQSAMTLVENTRRGGGKNSPLSGEASTATVLDVYENAAVVRITGPEWVDYLQMAKWNGRWLIVNVLWELHPDASDEGRR